MVSSRPSEVGRVADCLEAVERHNTAMPRVCWDLEYAEKTRCGSHRTSMRFAGRLGEVDGWRNTVGQEAVEEQRGRQRLRALEKQRMLERLGLGRYSLAQHFDEKVVTLKQDLEGAELACEARCRASSCCFPHHDFRHRRERQTEDQMQNEQSTDLTMPWD